MKNRKIILIPDGLLNYLPFELLIKDQKKDYSDYQYLVKDYAFNYYPSATVLHFERTKAKEFPKERKGFLGVAVEDFQENHCYKEKTSFSRLTRSISEFEAIAKLFPEDQ